MGPLLIFRNGKEGFFKVGLGDFDNWGDKLHHEVVNFDERGPEVMDEVDYQSFNVGPIVILICHYHYPSIS